jgi:hypothetical protein
LVEAARKQTVRYKIEAAAKVVVVVFCALVLTGTLFDGSTGDPWFKLLGWASAGYLGAFWLAKKGYMVELGCGAWLMGVAMIALPLIGGPLFLVAALVLPDRWSREQ